MEKVRLLEIAYESLSEHEPLRRAVIEVRNQGGKGAINTVMIFTVKKPCVQLGEFQDIDEELYIQECHHWGVDISRRVGGGGCLFYDQHTRFAVALLHRGFFVNLEEAAKIWQGEVITGTLHSLGAKEAWYRHIGDVQIGQTKVAGLGTAFIQDTLYLGSFMNIGTPQVELALKVLKIPPEKFADKPVSQLGDYVTSVEKVTGRMPAMEEFRAAVSQNVERSLGVELIPGEITPEEKGVYEKLRSFYTSPEWIFKRSSEQKFAGLTPGTRKGKSRYKARKLIIAQVVVDQQKKIDQAMLCGDFFIQPSEALEEIEINLRGVEAGDEGKIFSTVKDTLERRKAQTPMLTAEDFTRPLAQAAREAAASASIPG
jgi:lipoate---protein ligase